LRVAALQLIRQRLVGACLCARGRGAVVSGWERLLAFGAALAFLVLGG